MKYLHFLITATIVGSSLPSITATPLDFVSIKGTVHAVKYEKFENEKDFTQQIICNEKVLGDSTELSKFEFLVSSGEGYYGEAEITMGKTSFKALGFKGLNSRLFVDDQSKEFDNYRGALMSLSARCFGAGMPTLEYIFQGSYTQGYIYHEKEEITYLDTQWIVEKYSNLGLIDFLIFSKDETSACGVSLRFSFRTIKNDEDIETGMLDMFSKGVLAKDPEISDESLNQLIEEYKNSVEFKSELKQLLDSLKSSREIVLVNKYDEGFCYRISGYLEALTLLIGDAEK